MMTSLGPHAGFILAAYGATALILSGLALAVWSDYRTQKRRLAELQSRMAEPPAEGLS